MATPRVACLFVPLFPLAARLRSEPALKGEAVAIFEGNGNTARVIAATRKAREKGIEPGMTLPQARSLFPKLVACGRDRESERSAQEALLEVADSFSPRVEDAGGGTVFLDLTGHAALSRAFPLSPWERDGVRGEQESTHNSQITNPSASTPNSSAPITNHKSQITNSSELCLARDIIAAAEKVALPLKVGIAGSKLAARVAANLPDSPKVVPEGEEAAFLAPLPLSKLAPALEIAETLERWGIRAIGELAKLPEAEVASRLGELGRQLHATARGIDPRPLEPRLSSPCFSEGMELEWPLLTLEPFLFLGNAALERLVQRLESQALACTRLEIGLKLDPDGHDARAIALPAPTRDVKTLLTLVRLELEARPPGAPVVGFTFTAHPDKPRRAQLSLFGPAALSPDKLATTIARLAALLGADRIGSPRTVDGHRPERFASVSFAPPPPPDLARPPKSGRGLLSIRVLRPPVELEVIVESSLSPWERVGVRGAQELTRNSSASITNHQSQVTNSSRPVSLKSSSPDATPPIQGTVKVAAGPWSLEEGWWSEAPTDRDYWDIELSDGGLYRIYRDRKNGAWFADGVYD
jgi:protein ImuB